MSSDLVDIRLEYGSIAVSVGDVAAMLCAVCVVCGREGMVVSFSSLLTTLCLGRVFSDLPNTLPLKLRVVADVLGGSALGSSSCCSRSPNSLGNRVSSSVLALTATAGPSITSRIASCVILICRMLSFS
jgi:hypothetical protein